MAKNSNMTNRPDLIAQLSKLTPTEGEWHADMYGVHSEGEMLYIKDQSNYSDDTLITLAPQMRTELIRMDEELKSLKKQNEELKVEIYKNNRKPHIGF